jgi:hypothetical protein
MNRDVNRALDPIPCRVAEVVWAMGGVLTTPTRHFVVLSKVWFFIVKNIVFEAYPLLAPKCRVGARESPW